ncbi:MAG: DNA/RNA non-specific endonuclease [Bacteroidaceae bacterium]|nr:DNA/RNA non-specific endonuclease [Bacteroidaceae bacterium]
MAAQTVRIVEQRLVPALLISVLLLVSSCLSSGRNSGSGNIRLEEPAFSSSDNIIEHSGYTVCYNDRLLIPNWVAWELTSEESEGRFPRSQGFEADPEWRGMQADDRDYRGSGWTRGHMAPAGDMKWSEQAMLESFYLTNVCPQDAGLNDGSWNWVEKKCRDLARAYGKVWICCGPIVNPDSHETIGTGGVAVPESFFKVILYKSSEGYQAIGFVFRNSSDSQSAGKSCMSVDEVERKTGLDFFPSLKDDVEDRVEADFDWNALASCGR